MLNLQMLLCIALLLQTAWPYVYAASVASKPLTTADKAGNTGSSALESVLRAKSRQSRCVRCYEDRYYGSSAGSLGGAGGAGGYGSRAGDERDRGSWYYPSYDRYDERSSSGSGYRDRERDRYAGYRDDRYSSYRDDRYAPRPSYDRYEGRGYDEYSRGAGYERGGYGGYDTRDRYYNDRYGDYYRDRYSADRYRGGASYDRYERDPYDRYYSRYDFRNYRPWDETYRGQSGFDNTGRGYYFAGEQNDRQYLPLPQYEREPSTPCGHLVANCPYGSSAGDRGTKVSSGAIDSSNERNGHTNVIGKHTDNGNTNRNNGQSNSWTYMNDSDKPQEERSSAHESASNNGGRERDQQSSSFGGRPPRPLSGSYLFDRENNMIGTIDESANATGDSATNGAATAGQAAAEARGNENSEQAQK